MTGGRSIRVFKIFIICINIIFLLLYVFFFHLGERSARKYDHGVVQSAECSTYNRGNAILNVKVNGSSYSKSINSYECTEMTDYFNGRYVKILYDVGSNYIVDITYKDRSRFSEKKSDIAKYSLFALVVICANFWAFCFYIRKLKPKSFGQ